MADLGPNKQTVLGFYKMAFNDQPPAAVAKYVGSKYIQYNPQAPDGPEAMF